MKKILFIISIVAIAAVSCRKRSKDVSQVVTASSPTITITGDQFYSIPVGGTLPQISATAYDSVLHESYPVAVDQSTLDNSTPGLYVVNITSKNKLGYKSSLGVYVAVTDISPSINLAGDYKRTTGVPVHIDKLANGLYLTDNVAGIDPATGGAVVPAYFVQINDTDLSVPTQNDLNIGSFYATDAHVSMQPADTEISWIVIQPTYFLDNVRTFVKQ